MASIIATTKTNKAEDVNSTEKSDANEGKESRLFEDLSNPAPEPNNPTMLELVCQIASVLALLFAIPIIYASTGFFVLQMHNKDVFSLYLLPVFTTVLRLKLKEIPTFTVLVMAAWTYGVSSMAFSIAKAASDEGVDTYGKLQVISYRGKVLALKIAHEASMESFPLFAISIIFASVSNVTLAIRAQFSALALVAHIVRYTAYIFGRDLLRTVAHATFLTACATLLALSTFPELSKTLAQLK